MSEKPRIIAVVGPTASGKTALAVSLALELGGEVVSCDSMQVYRQMDIGTAKPTLDERCGVRHHLLDIAEPEQAFSVVDYLAAANAAVEDILTRGKLPIFCGGTGLYLDAFLRGGVSDTPGADPAVREELTAFASRHGNEALHQRLREVDPESADAIHPNNLRRVVRALELWQVTGVTKSEWDRRSRTLPARFDATVLGLSFHHRELLYERIERRVDQMLREGLVEETGKLLARGVFEHSPTAAAAIGYKELLPYLGGECDLESAVLELKTATRRYAKRQLTWFAAKEYVNWLTVDEKEQKTMRKYEEIVKTALELCARGRDML